MLVTQSSSGYPDLHSSSSRIPYAASVWDPHQRGLVNTLECVQKFALKASTIGTGMLIMTLIRTCFGRAVSAP